MYTEEQQIVISNLQNLDKQLGKTPSATNYRASSLKPPIDKVIKLFGSWNEALVAAKLPVRRSLSERDLIDALQLFYKTEGRVPVQNDFKHNPKYPSYSTFQRKFGTWNRALEAAGLPILHTRPNNYYSKESIIKAIQQFYNINNRVPKYIDFTKNTAYPSASTVENYFGSWRCAIEAAGYSIYDNVVYNEDSIIKAIQQFYLENNRIPQRRDFSDNSAYPGYTTVANYFGSWNAAITAAGFIPTTPNLYGVATQSLDGHTYRSKAEAYFADNYLFGKYDYKIEPRYPEPYKYVYDWYIPALNLYIELTAGLHPERIQDKININKYLNRKCLVVDIEDIYKKDFKI